MIRRAALAAILALGAGGPAAARSTSLRAWCATHAATLPYAPAIRQAFPDMPVMVRVSCCESKGVPTAGRRHASRGLFQVNAAAHAKWLRSQGWTVADLYVPSVNLAAARHVLATQGLRAWSPSRRCWG